MKNHYIKKIIPLVFAVAILFNLKELAAQTQIGNTLLGTEKYDGTGDAVAMSGDGNRIIFGSNLVSKSSLLEVGEVKVYELQSGNWIQLGSTISGTQTGEELGTSVDINDAGTRIACSGERGVKVYDFQNGNWQLSADYSAFPEFNDAAGGARRVRFANNGKILAVGDEGFDNALIVVYEETNNNWVKKGSPIIGTSETFTFAITKNGNRLAIPDGFEIQFSTFSYDYFTNLLIYDFEDNNWVSNHIIKLVDSTEIATSGESDIKLSDGYDFSANGNKLVLMASNDEVVDEQGFLYTFEFENGVWKENIPRQEISMDNPMGATLRLSDDGAVAAVGITDDVWSEQPNYVSLFQFKNQSWQEIGTRFTGSGSDEYANNFVDISNDGSKMIWGGKMNNPTDSLGIIKVYDYRTVLPIKENLSAKSIAVYPNPTKSQIYVSIDDENLYKVILLDIEGRPIKTMNYLNKGMQISLDDVASGIYFLSIYDNESMRVSSKKIVKM
ncbi:MAG: T9SS type A sorting domain-containing protein [Chitinophagales bacterium]